MDLWQMHIWQNERDPPPILVQFNEPDRDQSWNQKSNTSVTFCLSYLTFRLHRKPPLFQKLLRGWHFLSIKNTKDTQNTKLKLLLSKRNCRKTHFVAIFFVFLWFLCFFSFLVDHNTRKLVFKKPNSVLAVRAPL